MSRVSNLARGMAVALAVLLTLVAWRPIAFASDAGFTVPDESSIPSGPVGDAIAAVAPPPFFFGSTAADGKVGSARARVCAIAAGVTACGATPGVCSTDLPRKVRPCGRPGCPRRGWF